MAKKTCFVIQVFGKKQDYQTGRTLDLADTEIRPGSEWRPEIDRALSVRHVSAPE